MTRLRCFVYVQATAALLTLTACGIRLVNVNPREPVVAGTLGTEQTVLFGKIGKGTSSTNADYLTTWDQRFLRLSDRRYYYIGFKIRRMDERQQPVGEQIEVSADSTGFFMLSLEPGAYWVSSFTYYEHDPNKAIQIGFSDKGSWSFDQRSRGFDVAPGRWNNLGTIALVEATQIEKTSSTTRAWILVFDNREEIVDAMGLDEGRRRAVTPAELYPVQVGK